jgi:hypothetical protein
MASTTESREQRDRIRELFYEAVEGFPAELRDKAEMWLYEREVSQTMLAALEGLANLRHRR